MIFGGGAPSLVMKSQRVKWSSPTYWHDKADVCAHPTCKTPERLSVQYRRWETKFGDTLTGFDWVCVTCHNRAKTISYSGLEKELELELEKEDEREQQKEREEDRMQKRKRTEEMGAKCMHPACTNSKITFDDLREWDPKFGDELEAYADICIKCFQIEEES
ncbi:hypothetical protein N7520_010123 [Penicillium odoratum]|uniref:uncharacterized protein n=1 Tax=Penicillium odoratum TaxID=1167516 RepID=UPI0025469416|nr:uncharacterized protein N7520_010123 [Penicillium odoratum]KAJ5753206.1 hypothetical protein N7520_010123 [Penicillium odoratum]